MIEKVFDGEVLIAIVIRKEYKGQGIEFFTKNEMSQQLGYMNRPAGYVISPHVHNPVARSVHYSQECLFVRSGRVRVDFYTTCKNYISSLVLRASDVVLLIQGGHGFEILEDAEIIEVKQGPYAGDRDKTRFESSVPKDKTALTISGPTS